MRYINLDSHSQLAAKARSTGPV